MSGHLKLPHTQRQKFIWLTSRVAWWWIRLQVCACVCSVEWLHYSMHECAGLVIPVCACVCARVKCAQLLISPIRGCRPSPGSSYFFLSGAAWRWPCSGMCDLGDDPVALLLKSHKWQHLAMCLFRVFGGYILYSRIGLLVGGVCARQQNSLPYRKHGAISTTSISF